MLRNYILFMIYGTPMSVGKAHETGFSQKFVSRLERGQDKNRVTMCSTAPKAENLFFTKLNSPNLFRLHYRSNQAQLSTKSEIAKQIDNDYRNVAQNESTKV